MRDKRLLGCYTLIEIAVAVAILALLSGIVIVRVAKTPASIALDNFSSSVQGLFASASFMAQSSGETVEIAFEAEERRFHVSSGASASSAEILSADVPDGMEISFDEGVVDEKLYRFHPDGGASGRAFSVVAGGKRLRLSISPLTGVLMAAVEEK